MQRSRKRQAGHFGGADRAGWRRRLVVSLFLLGITAASWSASQAQIGGICPFPPVVHENARCFMAHVNTETTHLMDCIYDGDKMQCEPQHFSHRTCTGEFWTGVEHGKCEPLDNGDDNGSSGSDSSGDGGGGAKKKCIEHAINRPVTIYLYDAKCRPSWFGSFDDCLCEPSFREPNVKANAPACDCVER